MENAVDALKMAFAVIVFCGALTATMYMFGRAKSTAESIIYTTDDRNYYSHIDESEYTTRDSEGKIISYITSREVGIKDIVPTLYRYSDDKYRVEFYKSYTDINNNVPINIYEAYKSVNDAKTVNYFDTHAEYQLISDITGTKQKTRDFINVCIYGKNKAGNINLTTAAEDCISLDIKDDGLAGISDTWIEMMAVDENGSEIETLAGKTPEKVKTIIYVAK